MARTRSAQLDLELADDPPPERPDEPSPVRRPRAKPEARGRWRGRLRGFLPCAGSVLLALAATAALTALDQFLASNPRFVLALPNLSFEGMRYAPRAALLEVFRQDIGRSIYLMPLAARRRGLLAIDWVGEATVRRRWPDRVLVRIAERKPVAFVMLPAARHRAGAESYQAALIDAGGVILDPPARARFHLPVLFGLSREQPLALRRERVRQMLELIEEVQAYAGQISEIDLSDPEDLKITQTVDGRALRLLLGSRRFLPRLRGFLTHYPEIRRRLPQASVFDLRLDDRITAVEGAANAR